MNDDPTHVMRLEEAYQKITQESDNDSDQEEAPLLNVYTKPTAGLPHDSGPIIDLTESDDEAHKYAKVVIKQEVEDVIVVPEKGKGKSTVKPAKGGPGGGSVVTKTYRHGDGKVMGKAAVTESVLGAVADHLSPEAQEKRERSRMDLLCESHYQDRQDRVLEEKEKEIEDLRQQNGRLLTRAISAETSYSVACGLGFQHTAIPFVYPPIPSPSIYPPVPGPSVYPPSIHTPTASPFAANPSQYAVIPTIHNYSEQEGIASPGLQNTDYHKGGTGVDGLED